MRYLFLRAVVALALSYTMSVSAQQPQPAQSQQESKPASPQKFPGGLDVPYVPTNYATVAAMLRIANVGPEDYVIELGSGDGRILIEAAKTRGARGFGVDLDPQRVTESSENAKVAGVADRVQFFQRNLFDTKIAEANVIMMYLLPRVNLELRPRLFAELNPGTRIVSHAFDMGEWTPDMKTSVRGTGSDVYFWIIPAKAEGKWKIVTQDFRGPATYDVEWRQQFQDIEGRAERDGRRWIVRDARIMGEKISFVLNDDADYLYRMRFEGVVNAGVMEGVVYGEGSAPRTPQKWRASKTP